MAIAQTEFGAMKEIDSPEIALLCTGGQTAAQHARPGEKGAPRG
jgi:hypothetical protein